MKPQTVTSSAFNRDSGAAKRAAENGPVVITDRGAPSHVLMTWDAYQKLAGPRLSIAQALRMPGIEDIPFDPPRVEGVPSAAKLE